MVLDFILGDFLYIFWHGRADARVDFFVQQGMEKFKRLGISNDGNAIKSLFFHCLSQPDSEILKKKFVVLFTARGWK
ncbi:MAG: hypothetical protein K0R10_1517 [Alphaproteobacteria bacterium]|nr:hypothetical protein [Alphaproteobacteria bacterium]